MLIGLRCAHLLLVVKICSAADDESVYGCLRAVVREANAVLTAESWPRPPTNRIGSATSSGTASLSNLPRISLESLAMHTDKRAGLHCRWGGASKPKHRVEDAEEQDRVAGTKPDAAPAAKEADSADGPALFDPGRVAGGAGRPFHPVVFAAAEHRWGFR